MFATDVIADGDIQNARTGVVLAAETPAYAAAKIRTADATRTSMPADLSGTRNRPWPYAIEPA
jgi:hypothetical protein